MTYIFFEVYETDNNREHLRIVKTNCSITFFLRNHLKSSRIHFREHCGVLFYKSSRHFQTSLDFDIKSVFFKKHYLHLYFILPFILRISVSLDQSNFTPTPPLTQSQSTDKQLELMLGKGRGRCAVPPCLHFFNFFGFFLIRNRNFLQKRIQRKKKGPKFYYLSIQK